MQEARVRSLEEEAATHSSILAWEIARTEEPGGLQSMGSQDSDTTERLTHTHTHTHVCETVSLCCTLETQHYKWTTLQSQKELVTSLVVQWLRIPCQCTWVQSLIREDSTCLRAAESMRHNYRACSLEPVLCSKRSHGNEKPHSPQLEEVCEQQRRPIVKWSESCSVLSDSLRPHGLYIQVDGILQARILEWVAFPSSRGSSQPRDRTQVSGITGGFFTS